LQKLGEELKIDFYRPQTSQTPLDICLKARDSALKGGYDLMLIDTAGRLHIDEALMLELREIKAHLKPKEVLLVADAMTGQDAVRSAKDFVTRKWHRFPVQTREDWEKKIKEYARQNEFPVFENPCPSSKTSKRGYIKKLLQNLEKDYKGTRENIFKSLRHVKRDYLWG
jgi:hypothetical protein